MKKEEQLLNKRYTLATRDVNLESLIVASFVIVIMIVWACVIQDNRFLFVPLLFLVISIFAFALLLFRFFTEPKIAIQADCNGIYLYFKFNKEIFINYNDIKEISHLGIRNKYGRIVILTSDNKYESIKTKEPNDVLFSQIKLLLETKDKEKYLIKITK